MPKAIAGFDVTKWDQQAYDEPENGPHLSRATVEKSFRGDLVATSTAEVLMCQTDPNDYLLGAGYIASERVTGTLLGKDGSFVMQHGGLSGAGSEPHTFGRIVPGSGTGELEGISGIVMITRDEAGTHTLTMDVEFKS